MTIKAALLDERGIFLRMDDLPDEHAFTARHLPQITACDLPPGRYKWVEDDPVDFKLNSYGGAFIPLEALARKNRPDFEHAFIDLIAAVESSGVKVPDSVTAWMAYSSKRAARRRSTGGRK